MTRSLPTVSFVIPTYNSERVLAYCLESIRVQDYPRENIQIVIADGGSVDATLDIAQEYQVETVVKNPLRTGEAGKFVGVEAALNELVALVDSDNVLDGVDWLKRMVEPFQNLEIVASEPIRFTYRKKDSLLNRYCALIGMNDPLCLYLGNYNRYSLLTGKWTNINLDVCEYENYIQVSCLRGPIPTFGANGFVVRRSNLISGMSGPWLWDIDNAYRLLAIEHKALAVVKVGIIHLFGEGFRSFARKQRRRVLDYYYYRKISERIYPWQTSGNLKIAQFILETILVVPLIVRAFKGFIKKPDIAWLFHPLFCWITLMVYSYGTMYSRIIRKPEDRSHWQAPQRK